MPRPRSLIARRPLKTHIDESLLARLDLLLFSESEQRVPVGAYRDFFEARLREFFSDKRLDLAPYLQTMPSECVVRGADTAIARLKEKLESI